MICPDCGEQYETAGHVCQRTFVVPSVPVAYSYTVPKTRERKLEELVREAADNLERRGSWDVADWIRRAREVL